MVDHVIIDANSDYKSNATGLNIYIGIKYAFEKQQIMIKRSIAVMYFFVVDYIWNCIAMMFPQMAKIYKINFFEVKIYENGEVIKE